MAANNKRVATKYIRDGIKAKYNKAESCEICGSPDNLELHHYNTVSLLLRDYAEANSIPISTDKEVLAMREAFYQQYSKELIEDTVTLCKEHHALLHKTYGRTPPLHTAVKQAEWVKRKSGRDTSVITDTINNTDAVEDFYEDSTEIPQKRGKSKAIVKSITCDLRSFKTLVLPLGDFKV